MSKIWDMLKKEKVEWKRLGEVFSTRTGYTPSKSKTEYWTNGTIPWFTVADIRERGRILYDSNKKININGVKKELFRSNSIVFSIIATIGEYALIETDFVINQQFMVFTLRDNYKNIVNMQFINYYFHVFSEWSRKNARVGNVPTIDTDKLLKLKVPIPSLEAQEKIVDILDRFTECTTNLCRELNKELELRTQQYEYYRNMLLSEEYLKKASAKIDGSLNVELKNCYLEDIVKIKNGKDWKTLNPGNIPVYGSGGKMNVYVDRYAYDKPTVLIPRKGSIENVFYLEEHFWNVDTIFYTEIDDTKIIPKYFYYFVENYDIVSLSTDSTRPSLTQSALNKISITLPSIEVQEHIVTILDKFHTIVHDLKIGLPREIELRQKQYEYYSKKLFAFNGNDEI